MKPIRLAEGRPLNTPLVWLSIALAVVALIGQLLLPPSSADSIPRVALRALLVYPGWLLLPGLPWVGWFLARRGLATDPILAVLGSVGVSAGAWVVVLAGLKAYSWTPAPMPYLGLSLLLTIPALPLLWRAAPLVFQLPGRSEIVALAGAAVALLILGAASVLDGARPLDAYWYHPRADEGDWSASLVRLEPQEGWGEPIVYGVGISRARAYTPVATDLELVAESSGPVTVVLLLRAEVGATLTLQRGDDLVEQVEIRTHPVERSTEGGVLRYWDTGTYAVIEDLYVERGEQLTIQVDARPGFRLYDLTSSGPDGVWSLEEAGLHMVHYYQLLNIAENVAWARELWTTRTVTLNQPPMWAYFHAGASLLGGRDLAATYFVFLLVLFAIAAVGIRLVATLEPQAPLPALLLPVAGALYHGHHVLNHCEANFPDNMFALSITAACLALTRADLHLFGGVGLAATVLRYPGSAILTAAAVLHGLLVTRLREAGRSLAALWVPIAAFCLLMLVAGAAAGKLGEWFGILHFETFPEHWHGEYEPGSLLPRIPGFYKELLVYSGYLPLFALPLLGRGSRWLFGLALSYSLLLCTIDHFTIHYHLPLIALLCAAAGCNVGGVANRLGAIAGIVLGTIGLLVAALLFPW